MRNELCVCIYKCMYRRDGACDDGDSGSKGSLLAGVFLVAADFLAMVKSEKPGWWPGFLV